MASSPRILAFSGSLRSGSYNKKLAHAAAVHAKAAGADVTEIDLRDFPLPVFDEDLEAKEGLHPNARQLKDLFLAHQGLIISTPEYNSSYSAALKNAIDWISRPAKNADGTPEAPLACFDNKVVALYAASPGALGGIRVLPELRRLLANIKCVVLPDQFALAKAHEAFDESGRLKDPKSDAFAKDVATRLVTMCRKMQG
jgi:chromate reductase, NAD(P)H dehydrogenase (quinone)